MVSTYLPDLRFAPMGVGMTMVAVGATHPPCEDPGVVAGEGLRVDDLFALLRGGHAIKHGYSLRAFFSIVGISV